MDTAEEKRTTSVGASSVAAHVFLLAPWLKIFCSPRMTFFHRVTLLLLWAIALGSPATAASKAKPTRPQEGAEYKGAIVVDVATGKVLFEREADIINPPASMTKLMTFAVLHDQFQKGVLTLQTPVRITNADAGMAGTQVYLDPRETFPVEELIYAMMVQSANDAAHALARAAAGTRETFVAMMNAKARELGMTNTTFRTPHGLPPSSRLLRDGDLTSPRDFAILGCWLVKNTNILKYSSIEKRPFGPPVRAKTFDMSNHNNLLGKVDGVDGLKTGFTRAAGFCLTVTAQRQGRRLVGVIMGSTAAVPRDLAMTELLARGFAALPPVTTSPVLAAPTRPAAKMAPASVPLITPAPLPPTRQEPSVHESPTVKFSMPKR